MKPRGQAQKSGAALVVTLMLVGLMLMLVLFYVSLLRLETQISGYTYSDHLSRRALDRALAEAAAELAGTFETGRAYPPWANATQWVSKGAGGTAGPLLTEEVLEDLGWPVLDPDWMGDPEWILLGDTGGIHTAVAWVAVNLTGLPDPNTGPFAEPGGYWTAREFSRRVPGAARTAVPGAYSRDRGWYDFSTSTWQTSKVDEIDVPSLNPLDWTNNQVQAVFAEIYPAPRDHAAIAEAFLDFREGRTSGNPDGITAVPVPMFNEISATITVQNLGDDRIRFDYVLELEVWSPFPFYEDIRNFDVPRTPALSSGDLIGVPASFAAQERNGAWEFSSPNGPVANAFEVLQFTDSQEELLLPGTILDLAWEMAGMEIREVGGDPVDRLPPKLRLRFEPITIPQPGIPEVYSAHMEVKDPRLNHDLDLWVRTNDLTLGKINKEAERAQAVKEADSFDCWTPASLSTSDWQPHWIGFLPTDEPWQSVDLFGADGQWWLKHTRYPGWVPGVWKQGRLNPNGVFPAEAKQVFTGLPVCPAPGEDPEELEIEGFDQILAETLSAAYQLGEEPPYRGATHRGEWAVALEEDLNALPSRQHAEMLVGELLPLLDTTYHLWGILAVAETRYPGGGGRRVTRSAAEVIWMDPFPDPESGLRSWSRLAHHRDPSLEN